MAYAFKFRNGYPLNSRNDWPMIIRNDVEQLAIKADAR